jgi:hypothetical protein
MSARSISKRLRFLTPPWGCSTSSTGRISIRCRVRKTPTATGGVVEDAEAVAVEAVVAGAVAVEVVVAAAAVASR